MLVIMACGDLYDGPPVSGSDGHVRTLCCQAHGTQQLASLRTHITEYLAQTAPVPCNETRIASNIPATRLQIRAELAAMEAEHLVTRKVVFGAQRWTEAMDMASAGEEAGALQPVCRDRGALARSIAPAGGAAGEVMARTTTGAARRLTDLARRAGRPGSLAARKAVAEAGIAATTDAIRIYRDDGAVSEMGKLAWLSVVMADSWVRDDAYARMDPQYQEAHRRLWTDLTVWARRGYVAAPACLLAFTALQSGAAGLADVALDRALADRPGYQMALRLRDRIAGGPCGRDAAPPATAERVAAWYERQLTPSPQDWTEATRAGKGHWRARTRARLTRPPMRSRH